MMSPVRKSTTGFHSFFRGLGWLKKKPRFLLLLFIPMFLSVLLLLTTWGVFWQYSEQIFTWLLFEKPESWLMIPLFYLAKAFYYVLVFISGMIMFMLGINILSSPIYEYVSLAVERDLRPNAEVPELSLLDSIKLVKEEIKKVAFILLVSITILLIPGLNIISPVVTAFFIGWELYDFTLARRGLKFKQRLIHVTHNAWSILGFGIWQIIPGVQLLTMPLAVVGATILAIENLDHS